MKARELIARSGASYGPGTLRAIVTAFDSVWAEIAHRLPPNSLQAQSYPLELANALLAEAAEHGRNLPELKDAAIRRLQTSNQ